MFAKIIDSFGFVIALIVQLAVMTISMSLLGTNWYMKAGFICIGWVVVLFAVRAWLKGPTFKNRLLWACFALVSIFFSWSFALVGTEAQTQSRVITVTAEDDAILGTIRAQLEDARGLLAQAQKDYDEASRAETVADLLLKRDNASQRVQQLEEEEKARLVLIESGELTETAQAQASAITADRIFSALPDTVKNGRWIRLVIFGLIFVGLEITLVTAVEEERVKPAGEDEERLKEIDKIISSFGAYQEEPILSVTPTPPTADPDLLLYAETRWSTYPDLLPRAETIKAMNPEVYQRITEEAIRRGAISHMRGSGKAVTDLTKEEFLEKMQ